MIDVSNWITDEIIFRVSWNNNDVRCSLFVTQSNLYITEYTDETRIDYKMMKINNLTKIELETARNSEKKIFIFLYDKCGGSFDLGLSNSEKNREIAEKVFVVISKVLKS